MYFTGLHSLVSHKEMKGGSRIKLHRVLGQLLEEEQRQRRTFVVPPGEVYGKRDDIKSKDKEIACHVHDA